MEGLAGTSARDTEVRLPRATVVKNKQPADKQARAQTPGLRLLFDVVLSDVVNVDMHS